MDLIDIQRLFFAVASGLHPFAVLELVGIQISNNGSSIWAQLHAEAIRVAVVDAAAVFSVNAVFIHHANLRVLRMVFPEMPVVGFFHVVFLPAVKLADQSDSGCARSKGAKSHAMPVRMRAQILISVKYFPGIKSVKVHKNLLEDRRQSLFRLL